MSLVMGAAVVEWVAKRTNEFGNFGAAQGLGWQRRGKLVAGVAYAEWNGVNVVCHIAGEGKHWLTREFLWTVFDYPYNQLHVKRITVCVGEGNAASRKFVEHLGFTLECRLESAHPTGALFVYRMFRDECAYLRPVGVSHEQRLAA